MPRRGSSPAGRSVTTTSDSTPSGLVTWLTAHHAKPPITESVAWPGIERRRTYLLTTVDYQGLELRDNTYNPRLPTVNKVRELLASFRQMSLLSPLTCAFLEDHPEKVLLIDGRHRFTALQRLAAEDPNWAQSGRVDIKVLWGLSKSELHLLATYLNRTRRNLRKGEYYRAVVKIFQDREREMEQKEGRPPREVDVFNSINPRELTDLKFDLSVGRIVGMTAFDPEDEAWEPFVGTRQNDRYQEDNGETYFCPLTAGNLAEFLRYLCLPRPYEDYGEKRAVEIDNVVRLGRIFRDVVFRERIKSPGTISFATIASKFWCMAAFGKLISESKDLPRGSSKQSRLSLDLSEGDWVLLERMIKSYAGIMKDQAEVVRRFKNTGGSEFLKRAWSYQTQRDQVKIPLKAAMIEDGYHFSS